MKTSNGVDNFFFLNTMGIHVKKDKSDTQMAVTDQVFLWSCSRPKAVFSFLARELGSKNLNLIRGLREIEPRTNFAPDFHYTTRVPNRHFPCGQSVVSRRKLLTRIFNEGNNWKQNWCGVE